MYKSLMSILLVIVLLPIMPAAAKVDNEEVNTFLQAMGFVNKSEISDMEKTISRADFAVLAARIVSSELDAYKLDEQAFADVPEDHYAYDSIMFLYTKGYISGVDKVSFGPGESMNINDACEVLIKILGYDKAVPDHNYYIEASARKLLNNVNPDEKNHFTKQSAYQMIYNTLRADISNSRLSDGISDEKDNDTILSKRFKIYEISGIVTDDGRTSLTGESSIRQEELMIGGTVFVNETGMKDLLGCKIRGYYAEEDGKYILKYVREQEYGDELVQYDAEDVVKFEHSAYTVFTNKEDTQTKQLKLESNYKVIYNNMAYVYTSGTTMEAFEAMMKPQCGYIKLIDNDNNGRYDVVIVKSYQTVVVEGIDKENKTVYNKLSSPGSISLKDIEDLQIRNTLGIEMLFESVLESQVVSVAMSSDHKSYAEVIVSTETVKGKIEEFDDDKHITIEGKEYEYTTYIQANPVRVGDTITAYKRFDGKIIYHRFQNNSGLTYAYLLKVSITGGLKGTLKAKIYTADNALKEVVFADQFTIDGETYKKTGNALDYINGSKYGKNNIVSLEFDRDGAIISMDLAYNASDSDIRFRTHGGGEAQSSMHVANGLYRSNQKVFSFNIGNGLIAVDDTTKVFIIPENGADSDIYVTKPSSGYVSYFSPTYLLTAYAMDEEGMKADAVAIFRNAAGYDIKNSAIANRLSNYIVAGISDAVDEENNRVKKLTVTNGISFTDVYTKTINGAKCSLAATHPDIAVGDIIRYGTDKQGRIPDGQLVIMYSPTRQKGSLYYNTGTFTGNNVVLDSGSYGLVYCRVNRMKDKWFEIIESNAENSKKIYPIGSVKYIVYDSARGKAKAVQPGDYSDIKTYEACGNNCSTVILDYFEGIIQYMYIIK